MIVALATKTRRGGQCNRRRRGSSLAARIGEEIVLATAHVLDAKVVKLSVEEHRRRDADSIRMKEESDAAEIVGTVIGRLLPGPG